MLNCGTTCGPQAGGCMGTPKGVCCGKFGLGPGAAIPGMGNIPGAAGEAPHMPMAGTPVAGGPS